MIMQNLVNYFFLAFVFFSVFLYYFYISRDSLNNITDDKVFSMNATTGSEFQLVQKRHYKKMNYRKHSFTRKNRFQCSSTNFAVTTTINEPTAAIKQFINQTNVCLVIVADQKTSLKFKINAFNIFFLSVSIQKALPYNVLKVIPYNNFARKCIGYLFAIENGARTIYDFDDDNILINEDIRDIYKKSRKYKLLSSSSVSINPYDFFLPNKSAIIWPRGYPLENIKTDSWKLGSEIKQTPKIIQFLQNQNPDLDAIYRLTQEIPQRFSNVKYCVNINFSSYTPFNSQATLFEYEAFPTLILPITVNGRVSDIWRSFISQKILKSKSQYTGFCPAIVNHVRNPHRLIRDFNAEIPLYSQSLSFLELLEKIDLNGDIFQNLFSIYSKLYEYDIIQYYDLKFLDYWIFDLQQVGFH